LRKQKIPTKPSKKIILLVSSVPPNKITTLHFGRDGNEYLVFKCFGSLTIVK
jgi:hypothetical protein